MLGDEIGEKVVSVSFEAGKKLTTSALKKFLRGLLKILKKGGSALFHSNKKSTIQKLEKDGSQLQGISVDANEIAGLSKYMKKYGVDFNITRHVSDKTQYTLFFKVHDISKFERASEDFLNDKTLDNDSLGEKIKKAREEAFSVNNARQKERTKTKSKGKGKER